MAPKDPRKHPDERQSWRSGSIVWNEKRQRYIASIEGPADPRTGKRRRMYATAAKWGEAQEKLKELARKKDTLEGVTNSNVKLSVWLDEWLEGRRDRVKPGTYRTYRQAIENGIKPHLGGVKVCDLTSIMVKNMGKKITKEKTARQAFYAHSVLGMALQTAVQDRILTYNPAGREGAEKPKYTKKIVDRLSAAQAYEVLVVADRMPDNLFTRWAVALTMGLRQGEALGLTWDRVDLDNKFVDLSWQLQLISWEHGCGERISHQKFPCRRTARNCPQTISPLVGDFEYNHCHGSLYFVRPKSAESRRRVQIPEILIERLKEHKAETEWEPNPHNLVWHRESGIPYHMRADQAAWVQLLKESGMPHVRLHSARHTAASVLSSVGMEMSYIQRTLGHSSMSMTENYSAVDQGIVQGYMNKLGSAIISGELT